MIFLDHKDSDREQVVKVFLCWSGDLSKAVASALNDWLPDVIHFIETFFSDDDIAAGEPWFQKIDKELGDTYFGVLCITKSNKHSRWIHYEAGGLRKGLGKSRVVPLLIDLDKPTDLEQPLGAFQTANCDKDGIRKLLESINEGIGEGKLESERLERSFDIHWKSLSEVVEKHKKDYEVEEESEPSRTSDDKIDELLGLTRQIHQKQTPSFEHVPLGEALIGGREPDVLRQMRLNAAAELLQANRSVTKPGLGLLSEAEAIGAKPPRSDMHGDETGGPEKSES